MRSIRLLLAGVSVLLATSTLALAQAPPAGEAPRAGDASPADRVAVRYVTPETGGSARPRFLTERELAFFARIEGLLEQAPIDPNEYPEAYVRAALDRLVARSMLAALMIQRGVEPPDLPRLSIEARSELESRVGGQAVLADLLRREGIDDEELLTFLRDQVRAAFYIDRAITPILAVSEDALREAFRGATHPFRTSKFDDVRVKLRRWLVTERLRASELEFFQGARARVKIVTVRPPAPPSPPPPVVPRIGDPR